MAQLEDPNGVIPGIPAVLCEDCHRPVWSGIWVRSGGSVCVLYSLGARDTRGTVYHRQLCEGCHLLSLLARFWVDPTTAGYGNNLSSALSAFAEVQTTSPLPRLRPIAKAAPVPKHVGRRTRERSRSRG